MKIHLIDAPGSIYRFYHAIPPLSTTTGIPTNAIYGFARMMLKFMADTKPTHVGICFDKNSRAGRLEIDPNYKSNRPSAPSDIHEQIHSIKVLCAALGLRVVEYDGWEADDVVATLTKKYTGNQIEIITADKDFQQLITNDVTIWDPVKNKWLNNASVVERYGVHACQMADYQALIGDKTDNVPNIIGIGPANAAKLITQFGGVKPMIEFSDSIENARIRNIIKTNTERILINLKLVSFVSTLPIDTDISRKPMDKPILTELMDMFEFTRRMQPLVDALEM